MGAVRWALAAAAAAAFALSVAGCGSGERAQSLGVRHFAGGLPAATAAAPDTLLDLTLGPGNAYALELRAGPAASGRDSLRHGERGTYASTDFVLVTRPSHPPGSRPRHFRTSGPDYLIALLPPRGEMPPDSLVGPRMLKRVGEGRAGL